MNLSNLIHLRNPVLQMVDLGAPWGVRIEGCKHPGMYVVHRGAGHFAANGFSAAITDGDLVLVTSGGSHVLTDGHRTAPADLAALVERERASPSGGRYGGSGDRTVLSAVPFGASERLPFLPAFVHVQARVLDTVSRSLVTAYTRALEQGDADVVARIAEALWIRCLPAQVPRLAHLDVDILRAATRVAQSPGAEHSIASLARAAGLSRTRFCARFTAAFGESPMRWVSRERMRQADALLVGRSSSVAAVAEAVGFGDESSFRKAYRRITGRRVRQTPAIAASPSVRRT